MEKLKEFVELVGTNKYETDEAVLLDFGMTSDVWVPKSQLEDWPDVGDNGEVLMTEWMAEEKGLI